MSVTEQPPSKFGDQLTALQRDIICVLSGCGGANGEEVKRELEDYYESAVHKGRVYPNLDVLVEYGLVSSSRVSGRENRYELTDAGRRARDIHWSWQSSRGDYDTDFSENGAGGDGQ